jgi:membrane protein DedA with SNARE-associated domain
MIPTADVLAPIVNAATDFIGSAGLAGVFVLMVLESACIPIPSEAIMLFAGFSVSQGKLSLAGVVIAGVLGNVVGSLIAWAAGYYGRVELLERNRLIHVSQTQLERADRWFERYGSATVFFTRMVPIVRTFISLPAGVARMPIGRFTVLTAAGSLPWVLMLALVGQAVGNNWHEWKDYLHYVDYAVLAAIILGVIYLIIRRRRGAWKPTPPA